MQNRVFFLSLLLWASTALRAQFKEGGIYFQADNFAAAGLGEEGMSYCLGLPKPWQDSAGIWQPDTSQSYPLILFFHGAGERGRGNPDFALTHLRPFLRLKPDLYQAYVLVPQCPKDLRWVEHNWSAMAHKQDAEPGLALAAAKALLEAKLSQYPNIDTRRIYVVGLSMGGYATWEFAARWPERVAAAMPICGGGDPAQVEALKKLPIWAFHGALDKVVWPKRSRDMVEALRQAKAPKIQYTEYPQVAHDAWKPALTDLKAKTWLFEQKKPD